MVPRINARVYEVQYILRGSLIGVLTGVGCTHSNSEKQGGCKRQGGKGGEPGYRTIDIHWLRVEVNKSRSSSVVHLTTKGMNFYAVAQPGR